jgi:hypothetical protein
VADFKIGVTLIAAFASIANVDVANKKLSKIKKLYWITPIVIPLLKAYIRKII